MKIDTDKVSRAIVAGALTEAGRVYFPASAPWLDEWERELLAFDKGTHDDQVDTFSLAAHEVTRGALQNPRHARRAEPANLDERVARFNEKRFSKRKGRPIHPVLGRLR